MLQALFLISNLVKIKTIFNNLKLVYHQLEIHLLLVLQNTNCHHKFILHHQNKVQEALLTIMNILQKDLKKTKNKYQIL